MRQILIAYCFVAVACFFSGSSFAEDQAQTVSETTWAGKDIWGQPILLYFAGEGSLIYKTQSGIWPNGTWRQEGGNLYFEMNNKFIENKGAVHRNEVSGEGWTKQGYKNVWSATKQSSNLTSLVKAKSVAQPPPALPALLSPIEYVGAYEGTFSFDNSSLILRLECNQSSDCVLESTTSIGAAMPARHVDRASNIGPVPNWGDVQRALQYARNNQADESIKGQNSVLLTMLKPLLDSNAVIDKCIDLNLGGSSASLICHVSASPWTEPVLLFLGASLGPVGNGFSTYVIFPLFKKKS